MIFLNRNLNQVFLPIFLISIIIKVKVSALNSIMMILPAFSTPPAEWVAVWEQEGKRAVEQAVHAAEQAVKVSMQRSEASALRELGQEHVFYTRNMEKLRKSRARNAVMNLAGFVTREAMKALVVSELLEGSAIAARKAAEDAVKAAETPALARAAILEEERLAESMEMEDCILIHLEAGLEMPEVKEGIQFVMESGLADLEPYAAMRVLERLTELQL